MNYQNKKTFRITLIYFAILFLGIICTPTVHAQNKNYSFVTQWSAYANDTSYIAGIAINSSGTVYTTMQRIPGCSSDNSKISISNML